MRIPRHLQAERLQRQLRVERRESARERERLTVAELLQELRVVQTGVQILFAFLLGLAFSGRFTSLDGFEKGVYIATLLLTVITSAVIATPVALHRRMGHGGSNPRIVPIAAYIAEVGLFLLALSLNGAVLLVTDFVLGFTAALCITFGTASIFTVLWFFLPRVLRPSRRLRRRSGE
ncbi:DUF6328 family protein [Streptomyces sp. NPDC014846]|uniref:DUF6328 family protein n=1 Tax=Streptomyces sp. NPDC014846 TaxID=3364922 RepID=UPI0036F6AB2A